MRRGLVTLVSLFCYAQLTSAEIVEVPLPQLEGTYTGNEFGFTERRISFDLPIPPLVVHNAWIKLHGYVEVGSVTCTDFPHGPFVWPMEFLAIIRDTVSGGSWFADNVTPDTSGVFELTTEFRPSSGATWASIMDGHVELRFIGAAVGLVPLCTGEVDPHAELDSVAFVMDADFPVPTKESTWGQIKALYYD